LLALVGELAKRQLLLEFATKGAVLSDQVTANLTERLARGHRAIRLDANQDLRDIRVSNFGRGQHSRFNVDRSPAHTLVSSHEDMGVHLEVLAD